MQRRLESRMAEPTGIVDAPRRSAHTARTVAISWLGGTRRARDGTRSWGTWPRGGRPQSSHPRRRYDSKSADRQPVARQSLQPSRDGEGDDMIRSQRSGIQHNGGLGVDVFTGDEMEAIHWGTVEVLEKAGLWVEDDEAIDLFADGGCKVDRSTRKVKIPQHVLEEAISWAPSTVVLCGRTPDKDVVLEGRRVTYTNFAEGVKADRSLGRPAASDDEEGRRGSRPSRRCARRHRGLHDRGHGDRRGSGGRRGAPHRSESSEHHQADLQPGARAPRRHGSTSTLQPQWSVATTSWPSGRCSSSSAAP